MRIIALFAAAVLAVSSTHVDAANIRAHVLAADSSMNDCSAGTDANGFGGCSECQMSTNCGGAGGSDPNTYCWGPIWLKDGACTCKAPFVRAADGSCVDGASAPSGFSASDPSGSYALENTDRWVPPTMASIEPSDTKPKTIRPDSTFVKTGVSCLMDQVIGPDGRCYKCPDWSDNTITNTLGSVSCDTSEVKGGVGPSAVMGCAWLASTRQKTSTYVLTPKCRKCPTNGCARA